MTRPWTHTDRILCALDEHPWLTSRELAERLGMSLNHVQVTVMQLHQTGHAVRSKTDRPHRVFAYALAINEEAA